MTLLPATVRHAVERHLSVIDRLLPGRVEGYYVVGSTALGAFRPGRSDIDFVAVLAELHGASGAGLDQGVVRRLRVAQLASHAGTGPPALLRGQLALPGTLNGVFVAAGDLDKPVTSIRPLASQGGPRFTSGRGFDVNPATWQVLARHGLPVRGAAPDRLGVDPEPAVLPSWCLDQLRGHWQRWANAARSGGFPGRRWPFRMPLAPLCAAGALRPAGIHHTVVSGEVVSKEAAGEYALDTFDRRWHPLVRDALAYRRGERVPAPPADRLHEVGDYVREVIADAERRRASVD